MHPFVLAAFLVVAGNAASLLDSSGLPGSGVPRLAFGLIASFAVLAWSRAAGLRPDDLGLRRGQLVVTAGAALLALGAAAIGLLALRYQPIVPGPITYAPAREATFEALALHLLVFLPLGVALPEELAFRGALLAALARDGRLDRAVAFSSIAFALWHATIILPTIRATNLADHTLLAAIAIAGAAGVLCAGGVALARLRLRAGTLAASFLAHWAFNAAMLVGLRVLS